MVSSCPNMNKKSPLCPLTLRTSYTHPAVKRILRLCFLPHNARTQYIRYTCFLLALRPLPLHQPPQVIHCCTTRNTTLASLNQRLSLAADDAPPVAAANAAFLDPSRRAADRFIEAREVAMEHELRHALVRGFVDDAASPAEPRPVVVGGVGGDFDMVISALCFCFGLSGFDGPF